MAVIDCTELYVAHTISHVVPTSFSRDSEDTIDTSPVCGVIKTNINHFVIPKTKTTDRQTKML